MAARFTDHILTPGAHASLPDPALTPEGAVYPCTDHDKLYRNDGAAWQDWAILGDPGTASALADHLADTADAHDASAVSFAPTGNLAATDVQAALAELDTEKALAGHAHALDDLTDVDLTGAAEGNALVKTATGWGPGVVAGAGGSGGGTFRGEWTSTPMVVGWSDDFSDGTEAPFTHTFTGGGTDYSGILAYASIKGGAVTPTPTNMWKIGKTSTNGNSSTTSLALSATGVTTPLAVRFWWAQENSGGTLQFLRNGAVVTTVNNIPWTQRTETVAAGDTIAWKNSISADPYPSSYLARVEVLIADPDAAPYMTGEFVTHLGKLWKSDSDNNAGQPGTAGWTEVPIYKTAAASDVSYAGSTNLAATNVEAALDELDAEKSPLGHAHALDDLSDVDLTGATTGQALVKTASGWGPGTVSSGGGSTAGTYRGTWALSLDVVRGTYDFADGTIPSIFTTGGDVTVAAYAAVAGGAVVPTPSKRLLIRAGTANTTTYADTTPNLIAANLGVAKIDKVRFWFMASTENGWDFGEMTKNGVVQVSKTGNGPWTQHTISVLGTDALRWLCRSDSSGFAGEYAASLARLEAIETVTPNYQVNDLVTHKGALYSCNLANSTQEPGTGTDWTLVPTGVTPINAQTGTAYTLTLTDTGKMVTLTNTAAITLTVPDNATVAFPVGAEIDLSQLGAGQVTIAGAAGVTVNGAPGLKIAAQYGAATLLKVATDTWLLVGKLAA